MISLRGPLGFVLLDFKNIPTPKTVVNYPDSYIRSYLLDIVDFIPLTGAGAISAPVMTIMNPLQNVRVITIIYFEFQ